MFKPGNALERTPPPSVSLASLKKTPENQVPPPDGRNGESSSQGKKKGKKGKNKVRRNPEVSKKLESIQKVVDERERREQSSSESENDDLNKLKNENLKRGMSSESEDEINLKKAKNESYASQSESGNDDIEMGENSKEETTNRDDRPEPEVEMNEKDEIRNEGGNETAEEEMQRREDKEKADEQTRLKNEARERADREEFNRKMAEAEENKTVFIKGRRVDITKINPVKARKQIEELIGSGFAIFKSRESLKIIVHRFEQRDKLMAMNSLLDNDIIITEPFSKARSRLNSNRGIIFGVEEDISDDDMSEALGVKAERIYKRRAGEKIITKQMILYFSDELPRYVSFEWQRYKVSTYIPEVIRCYKCQRFGHKAPSCHAKKEKCTVCSGPHEVQKCPIKSTHRTDNTATCPNCKGPHPASYQGCPEFKIAKQAQKKHVLQGISYAEAIRRCRVESEENLNTRVNTNAEKVPPSAESTSRPSSDSANNRPNSKPGNVENTKNSYMMGIDVKKISEFVKAMVIDIRAGGTNNSDEIASRVHELLQKLSDQIHENTKSRIEGQRGNGETDSTQSWQTK